MGALKLCSLVNIPGPLGVKFELNWDFSAEFAVKLPKDSSDLVLSYWKAPKPLMDELDPWGE